MSTWLGGREIAAGGCWASQRLCCTASAGAWSCPTDTPGSGLLQLGARFYRPEVGRFLQQDPAQDEINWYDYSSGNPVTAIDPEGLSIRSTISGSARNPIDHIKCASIMRRYYNEMRKRNWIGADAYYHCLASCECAHQTNPKVAWIWGVNREVSDGLRGKEFSKKDIRANYCGVTVPRNMSCEEGCEMHRPKGMPV